MNDAKQDSEQTTKSEADLVEDDQQDQESTSLADPTTSHAASDSETLLKKKTRSKRKSELHGEYDIYGQFVPYISEDVLICTICGRQILAAKYSSHLSRCMGYGRTSASRSS